ncbi:MAG: hypothetical protein HY282_08575 [Nitrospirae bacterium]|nr:hypothetical protein [Candidatus Manganitrophaceae bacterium]
MRRYRFLFVIILFLLIGQTATADESGRTGMLEIYIKSDKPIYKTGEPIFLTVRLKNNTDGPLIVSRRLDPFNDLQWELFAEPQGFMPIKTAPAKGLTPQDFVELKPNEQIEKRLPPLSEITSEPLKRGLYGVRLTYTIKEAPQGIDLKGKDFWTGEIVTNRLSIQIRPGEKASLSEK